MTAARRRQAFALWGIVGLLAFACAGDPRGSSSQSLFDAAPGAEGEAPALAEVRAELGLVDDAGLTAEVTRIGRSVTRPAPGRSLEPSFHVVDQGDANVFTVSNRFVFVTRGLLALMANEAEFANLIAHELAHSEIGDLPLAASGLAALGIGSAVMQAAVGRRAPARFAAGASMVGRFAVDSESAADALGQQNAAAAGYDPAALVAAYRGMEDVRGLRAAAMPGFFDRHPSPRKRIEDAAARAAALSKSRAIAGAGTRPMDWLDGLLLGSNPADGLFAGERFVHHDLGYTLRLPRGWERLHARRAVGAVSPDGHAQVVLERQGPSGSPEEAGRIFLEGLEGRMPLQVVSRENLRSGGLSAHRAIAIVETPAGPVRLELHWFTLATGVLRLAGASRPDAPAATEVAMRNVARSLQPLSDRERAQIREERLRFVASEAGDDLGRLSRRAGNAWSLERTAAINRIGADAVLAEGTRIKVAERAPFRGRDLGANPVRR